MITDSQIFLFFLSIRSPIRQHHLSGWQSPKELWVPITQLLGVTNYLLRDLPVIRSCTKSSLVSRFPNNFCRLSQNGRSVLVFNFKKEESHIFLFHWSSYRTRDSTHIWPSPLPGLVVCWKYSQKKPLWGYLSHVPVFQGYLRIQIESQRETPN